MSSPKTDTRPSIQKKETPSFNQLFKKKDETDGKPIVEVEKRNTPFDMEKLSQAWNDFISSKKIEGASLSLLKNNYLLKDDFKIEIQLKSPLENSLLTKIEPDLIGFIRDRLNNDHVTISSKLNIAETQKKAYTSAEIFNEMAEKNPTLLKLKDALGLDTEF